MNSADSTPKTPERRVDSWDSPEGYYPRIAQKGVNRPLRAFAEPTTIAGIRLSRGNMEIIVPRSVKELADTGQKCIFVPTHRGLLDTVAAPLMTKQAGFRLVRPLAKGDLFKNPVLAWVLHELGAVAVKRGGDDFDEIIEAQVKMMKKGYSQMNFGEGTRAHGNVLKVGEIAGSIHLLAQLTEAPVITLGIAGFSTERDSDGNILAADQASPLGKGPKIVGCFSSPLNVGNKGRKEFTEEVRSSLQFCFDAAYEQRGSSLEIQNVV